MAIKTHKPTSAARRFMTTDTYETLTKKAPEKSLLAKNKKTGGRGMYGKITVRHIGGGNRRKYRIIDFKRTKDGIPAKVTAIEYDPNRSAYIALIVYQDGTKSYILAPLGLSVGDVVTSGPESEIKVQHISLENIPVGTVVHNVELTYQKGGQIARSVEQAFNLLQRRQVCTLRMPSGEMRKFCLKTAQQLEQHPTQHGNLSTLKKRARKDILALNQQSRCSYEPC